MKSFLEFITEERMKSAGEHAKWLKQNFIKLNPNMDKVKAKKWLADKKNLKSAYNDYTKNYSVGARDSEGYDKDHILYRKRK